MQLNKVRQLLRYDTLAVRSGTFFNACGCDLALLGKVELVNDKGGDCQQHDHGQHNEGDGDSRGPTGQELGSHLIRASRTRHVCTADNGGIFVLVGGGQVWFGGVERRDSACFLRGSCQSGWSR